MEKALESHPKQVTKKLAPSARLSFRVSFLLTTLWAQFNHTSVRALSFSLHGDPGDRGTGRLKHLHCGDVGISESEQELGCGANLGSACDTGGGSRKQRKETGNGTGMFWSFTVDGRGVELCGLGGVRVTSC